MSRKYETSTSHSERGTSYLDKWPIGFLRTDSEWESGVIVRIGGIRKKSTRMFLVKFSRHWTC